MFISLLLIPIARNYICAKFEQMKLEGNPYPGRGIVLGKTPDGKHLVQVYWIMGRSANSQNRIFSLLEDGIRIFPFDESKVEDPSLIIYDPIRIEGNNHIVSNGDQTATIQEFLSEGKSFEDAVNSRMFEPDAPNFTPRISGVINLETGKKTLSIIKTINNEEAYFTHQYFNYNDFKPGTGRCISTYESDGSPIPSFSGEPIEVEVMNTIEENITKYWELLNKDYLVSMAVKFVDVTSGESTLKIKNRFGN